METAIKGDKQGLGVTKRHTKRFEAPQLVTQLHALAHHTMVWARPWLSPSVPRIRQWGIMRMVRGYPLKAGHPLEGSCQEGKHPPYTPFCIFCRGMSHGISLPICRFARTRVFSGCDVTRPMATHQTPIRIKAHDGHLALWPGIRPLAHLVPQKTLGTLPCPIVTSTVHVALP